MQYAVRKLIWDYWMVTLFVITSGSIFWNHTLGHSTAYSIYLFFAIINYMIINKKQYHRSNRSYIFILLISFLCLISHFVNDSSYEDNSALGYIICQIATFMVIASYDFYYFRYLLTNVVFVLCVLGLPIFFFVEIGVLSYKTVYIGASGDREYAMFGIYTLGWPWLFHRFSGIWHEPGACQIVLNTIIWLHFENIILWKWGKYQRIKLLVIFIVSLTTFSTGGYICLMLLLTAVLFSLKFKGKNKIFIYSLFTICFTIAILSLFRSDVIQNKLFNQEEESISKIERVSDAIALWKMSLEKPLWGYGLGTVDFWKKSDLYGNTHCSSGLLTYTASLGFTWLFVFIIYLLKGIKKLHLGKSSLFLLFAVLLMQFNEKYIEYPISNILIFNFFSNIKTSKYYYA